MTLLWTSDPSTPDVVRFALGGGEVITLTSAQRVQRTLEEDPSHTLVVVGADVSLADAAAMAELHRVTLPELGVILLRTRVDVATLGEALRAGIREVVDVKDGTAIAAAVRRSQELTSQLRGAHDGDSGGKVITVFSAKGGVGKTTLATNLAVSLAATGARTLLVDLDVMFGDVGIALQLSPESSMADAIAMQGHLDAQALQSIASRHEASGLDVIAAPIDPGDAEQIPGPLAVELLRAARSHWQYVVVDTPPSITEHVLAAFDVTDLAILVATLDIPTIKNLRIAISTLDTLGSDPATRMIVLNRGNERVGLSAAEVEGALHTSIAHTIPHSLDVPASVNRGVPLVLAQPRHAVSAAIRKLVDQGVRARFGDVDASDDQPRRRLFGSRS